MLAPRKKLWSTPTEILDVVGDWIELQQGDKVCDIGCGDGRVLIHLAAHWTETAACASTTSSAACSSGNNDNDNNDELSLLSSVSFVGLDINPDRIEEATVALQTAQQEGRVHTDLSITFHCANAMQDNHLFQDATVFFLYLIPRGLKIFKPLLLAVLKEKCDKAAAVAAIIMSPSSTAVINPSADITDSSSQNSSENDIIPREEDPIQLRVLTYMSPLPGEKFEKRQCCEVAHQPGTAWPVFLYHLTHKSSLID